MSTESRRKSATVLGRKDGRMPKGAVKPVRTVEAPAIAQVAASYEAVEVQMVTQEANVATQVRAGATGVNSKIPPTLVLRLVAMCFVAVGSLWFLFKAITENTSVGIVTMLGVFLAAAIGALFIVYDWKARVN